MEPCVFLSQLPSKTHSTVHYFFLSFSRWISFCSYHVQKKKKLSNNLICYTGGKGNFLHQINECIQNDLCNYLYLSMYLSVSFLQSDPMCIACLEKNKIFCAPSPSPSYKTCYRYDSMTSYSHSLSHFLFLNERIIKISMTYAKISSDFNVILGVQIERKTFSQDCILESSIVERFFFSFSLNRSVAGVTDERMGKCHNTCHFSFN